MLSRRCVAAGARSDEFTDMEVVMGAFLFGFLVILYLSVFIPFIQWLSEPAPRQDDPEMKRVDLYA
jgi:hypothetical protein